MTTAMEIGIIARENIKPSSPTPAHLKTFKLSLLDQMVPPLTFHCCSSIPQVIITEPGS
ncbi:hypothetical protein CerSpe_024850 [Prunus speciosa]